MGRKWRSFIPKSRFFACLLLPGMMAVSAGAAELRIGVLAQRGPEKTLEMWAPTARYLERVVQGNTFRIVPLDFDGVRLAVRQGSIDFALTNSSYYVELETLYGVSAIATLRHRLNGTPGPSTFGGVLFTRADRSDIRTLGDLHDVRFAAVDRDSFGGWMTGWRELKRHGIDPATDFGALSFEHTQDAVVLAVRDGRADAGVVRTDTLERMAAEGAIALSDFYVLNRQYPQGFPFLLSTPLYPEWPMAKLRHVPDTLAERVAIALVRMSAEVPAPRNAMVTGWTLPLNYQPVRDAMRELEVGPYASSRRVTVTELFSQYGGWLVAMSGFVLLPVAGVFHGVGVNRRLRADRAMLEETNGMLEEQVRARTNEVDALLAREQLLRRVVEMVADVNQILITSTSVDEMLKACCDRLVANGDYRFAWVGMRVLDQLEVAARSYGPAELMREFTAGQRYAFVAQALSSNRTVVEPEPTDAAHDGLRAVALPLRSDAYGEPLGVLCVVTGREGGFDDEESSMLEQLAGDIGFAIHAFRQQAETRRLEQGRISDYEETILSLVDMIESRDSYTAGHTRRVAHYCELIARRMGHTGREIEQLRRAAVLHDIGKIAIPDAVLLKPGKLAAVEYELIKHHAEAGYRTLVAVDVYRELAEIMRSHHERENGSGYPRGLVREEIHPLSRIMAVADSFDAMTTSRIYKPRKAVDVALAELRQLAGELYSPEVVEAAGEVLRDVEPPLSSDQLPRTPLERQRFAYHFNDLLTGTHNAGYLQFVLRNGLPSELRYGYLLLLRGFDSINVSGGWSAGNEALARFGAFLRSEYPEAMVFRVMGDDFVLLTSRRMAVAHDLVKMRSPLRGTDVEVVVQELVLDAEGLERLWQME